MVLSAYFKKIEMTEKKLEKRNITVSDNDIIIHIIKQINDYNWFTKEHMTECVEQDNRTKREECKAHFERCYIPRKRYHDANGTKWRK